MLPSTVNTSPPAPLGKALQRANKVLPALMTLDPHIDARVIGSAGTSMCPRDLDVVVLTTEPERVSAYLCYERAPTASWLVVRRRHGAVDARRARRRVHQSSIQ